MIEAKAKLEQFVKTIHFLLNQHVNPIFVLDLHGNVVDMNKLASQLVGHSSYEVLSHFDPIFEEVIGEGKIDVKRMVHTEKAKRSKLKLNLTLSNKSQLPVDVLATPISLDNQLYGMFIIIKNDPRREAEGHLEFMAYHDYLTGLANRRKFDDELITAIMETDVKKFSLAVMFIDLDRFKFINDTLGYHAGDNVLKVISRRLKDCLTTNSLVARHSGDEFAILIKEIFNRNEVMNIAEEIMVALKYPIIFLNEKYVVSGSIGISMYPDDANNAVELLQRADQAMYYAKKKRSKTFQFYDDTISNELSRKAKILQKLSKAIEKKEFHLVYQPIVDVYRKEIVGLEALIRWTNSELGVVSPMEFIGIAEESNLIVDIGDWVLETVTEQQNKWANNGLSSFYISINMSLKQFQQGNIIESIENKISKFHINPDKIKIEITESLMMENVDDVLNKLNELSQLGIDIFLDDFGTGYSSLSHLEKLPFSTLKIDKSFVQEMTDNKKRRAIIRAIVTMARSMKMKVIAEGVEEVSQYHYLCSVGCHLMQGFHFSKPVPFEEVEGFFRNDGESERLI